MEIVDANVLIHAVNSDSPHHDAARSWLDSSLTTTGAVGFAWIVLVAFLRLITNRQVMPSPMSTDDAVEQVERWLRSPNAVIVEPGSRHLHVLSALLRQVGAGPNVINDAHIAAIAIEHDATVVSFDRDFVRFDGLRHRLP